MNKLEEQVENAKKEVGQSGYGQVNFKEGAQFVIDLELPVKFVEFLTQYFRHVKNGRYECQSIKLATLYNGEQYSLNTIYGFWIENIYGR